MNSFFNILLYKVRRRYRKGTGTQLDVYRKSIQKELPYYDINQVETFALTCVNNDIRYLHDHRDDYIWIFYSNWRKRIRDRKLFDQTLVEIS